MDEKPGASSNADEVADLIRAQLKQYQANIKEQLYRATDVLTARIVHNIRTTLVMRTGNLMNSIRREVRKEGEGWTATIKSVGVPYALIHEFGGVIKPKNAKSLAIPAEANRRRDGSPIITIQELFGGLGKSFTDKKTGTVFMITGKGRGKNAGMETLTPMFYLRKSVTIPARPYIRPAVAAKQEQILKDFGVFLSLAFKNKEAK